MCNCSDKFFGKAILLLLNWFCTVKSQYGIFVRVCLWGFYSVPLAYLWYLFLSLLFCSIDLCISFSAHITLSWLLCHLISLSRDRVEKAMAPHSSTLAWTIPWMEEPGRLQSMKSRTRLSDFHFHFSLLCSGEGNGNPLQCSCLENPRDRGAWWAAVYGVAESRTQLKRLSSSSRDRVLSATSSFFFWHDCFSSFRTWAFPYRV